jgi:hypothetical protein
LYSTTHPWRSRITPYDTRVDVIYHGALGALANEPENKSYHELLEQFERRLHAALVREASANTNLSNCCIADSSAARAQAAPIAGALALPAVVGTTTTTTNLVVPD